jgi:hypothetical protein
LVNATVTQVEAFEATAELPADSPKLKDVTPNAKAVLVSPAIKPLRVAFEGPQARLYTGSDGGVLAAIRAQLKSNDNKTIELIESAPGEVFVARGKFGQVFTNARDTELAAKDTETKLPQSGDEVYYLHVGDHVPMFGFFVKADDRQGGQKIANAFEKYARQRNLLALSNSVSPLNEGIEVSVLVVFGENTPDGFKEKSRELVKPREGQTSYTFDQDVYFRIQVENRTGKDVYVTVMNISTDGSINILYPPPGARDKLVAGKSVVTPLYVTTAPAGVEAYKVIATSTYTDFSFLEQVGVKNRNPISQLETLLNDTTAQKRSVPVKEVTLDDWGTREVKFLVSRNKRN